VSDLEALGNPEHKCGDTCRPYEPLADRDLEELEESAHIDALYADLNLVREHVALLLLALAKAETPTVSLAPRSIAILLDLSETEAACLLGSKRQTPNDVVNHAVNVAGEDGYMGQAMAAIFRHQMLTMRVVKDED
jgi:hypothetical protein